MNLPFHITVFVENLPIAQQMSARVSLESPEGGELGRVVGQFKIDHLVEPKAHMELPFVLPSIHFQRPGDYVVRVFIDDQEIGSKTLFLRAIPHLQTPTL